MTDLDLLVMESWNNKRMAWRLHIKDKVEVRSDSGKKLYCPAHTFPHKFPWKNPITDEPCHYHCAKWRMWHHESFCLFLKCSNYKIMIKSHKKRK